MPPKNFPNVVLLTPPGRGAVATLLVEGPGALRAVAAHFRTPSGGRLKPHGDQRLAIGRFGDDPGEEVVVRCRSDQAVELHCHGGQATVEMIRQVLVGSGCRPATWQEWLAAQATDPLAAAAQLALSEARTERTAAILLDQYHGALRRAMEAIRAAIGQRQGALAREQIAALLARASLGRHLVPPWQVVVAGRPNVGKSSLINALVGYPRSIVHPTAGTTRDVVTARTAIDGWPVQLADTAGLGAGGDTVERAGIALARRQMAQADLVLLLFDLSVHWTAADDALLAAWPEALVVHNKSDAALAAEAARPAGLALSALTGQGLEALVEQIGRRLVPQPPPAGVAVPFTEEQVATLRRMENEEVRS
ncbi:MAG: GTPase [Thermoguttaceae bacterium]